MSKCGQQKKKSSEAGRKINAVVKIILSKHPVFSLNQEIRKIKYEIKLNFRAFKCSFDIILSFFGKVV